MGLPHLKQTKKTKQNQKIKPTNQQQQQNNPTKMVY